MKAARVDMSIKIKAVIGMMTVKPTERMITGTILDIGPNPAMIIIGMSIFIAINIMAIGIRGIRGNTIKENTLITEDMVVTKGIITNCSSYLMMA
jgi:hypothetical protein